MEHLNWMSGVLNVYNICAFYFNSEHQSNNSNHYVGKVQNNWQKHENN